MNEQIIILIFLVLALGATLWLYILKAKKQVEYKGDERWLTIQLKANQSANIANWTLIILLAIATSVPLFIDIQIMFTLDRVILFGELFIGLRNLFLYQRKGFYFQNFPLLLSACYCLFGNFYPFRGPLPRKFFGSSLYFFSP